MKTLIASLIVLITGSVALAGVALKDKPAAKGCCGVGSCCAGGAACCK
jgi:hypothetical protein